MVSKLRLILSTMMMHDGNSLSRRILRQEQAASFLLYNACIKWINQNNTDVTKTVTLMLKKLFAMRMMMLLLLVVVLLVSLLMLPVQPLFFFFSHFI